MQNKTYILSKEEITLKIQRLAYEIVENNYQEQQIVLAGIAQNGIIISNTLKKQIEHIGIKNIEVIHIYIDKKNPQTINIEPSIDVTNKVVIIVDDVSMSGKTISYALKPFLNFYPAKIQTLVLIERQQKNFPIHSDYVGLHISTTLQEMIIVEEDSGELGGAYLV
jgi:pyrimidine operon attenuation protein / uracil phosphoribosyltransferase